VASKGLRVAARTLDLIAEGVLVVVTWWLFGELARVYTNLFLAFLAIWAYEALTTLALGATPGKRLVGLRVASLDTVGRPTLAAAVRRGAMAGALLALPIVGWGAWLVSVLADALGRGFPDRAGDTMVVPDRFARTVATRDLPGYVDGVRPPRLTPVGRVGDLDVRARARLRRLSESRLLAVAIGMLALAVSLPYATTTWILASSAAWIVVFVAHETWLVHGTGCTPGHRLAGLVIVDRRTGRPPGTVRSFLRALVLGLTLYVPPLWLLLGASLLMMRLSDSGRGLHDLAGGTVVVADARLDPETQRQRAMRLRLGRVG
jgi:uncharacterized RDD family membrane protein YckC